MIAFLIGLSAAHAEGGLDVLPATGGSGTSIYTALVSLAVVALRAMRRK